MTYAGPGDGAVVPGPGDGLITRKDAARWIQEQGRGEIVSLKPSLWGFSIDLKSAFRRAQMVARTLTLASSWQNAVNAASHVGS
jgi:hypothetical protein